MSITSDIRSYADTAIEQGKHVLDQAQSQLTDVTGQANGIVGKLRGTAVQNVSELSAKANDAVGDLRAQAEKVVSLESIKAAIEPYLAQAKGYSTSVTDRAEELLASVKGDKRVAKIVTKAEELTGTVVETVQDRVVKPVQSLSGLGGRPAAKPAARKPAAPKAAAPARPAGPAKATAKASPRKTTAKRTSAKS